MYLLFNTQLQAEKANNQITINILKKKVTDSEFFDGYLKDVTNTEKYLLSDLSPEELIEYGKDNRRFPLFGKKKGEINTKDGFTTMWAIPKEDVNGKWAILKPLDEYMENVVDFTEIEEIEEVEVIDNSYII